MKKIDNLSFIITINYISIHIKKYLNKFFNIITYNYNNIKILNMFYLNFKSTLLYNVPLVKILFLKKNLIVGMVFA